MKETTLSVGISADCTWHGGSVVVVSHVGPDVLIEQLAADMSVRRVALVSVGSIGNAAPRICSSQGVLWLAYRDSQDHGFLVRLDTGEVHQLGAVFGQRPFAFGFGSLAVQVGASLAAVSQLSLPGVDSATQIPVAPTGLSHIDRTGRVWTWEELRTRHPWGVGFTIDGPATFAEEPHDRGLVGTLAGQTGYFWLWPQEQMRDPRCSVNGPDIAVCGWSPHGPIRVAVVTAADLVPDIAEPPVPPLPPFVPVPVRRYVQWGWFKPGTDASVPGSCVVPTTVAELQAAVVNGYDVIPDTSVPGQLAEAGKHQARVPFLYVPVENDRPALVRACQVAAMDARAARFATLPPLLTYSGATNEVVPGTVAGYQMYLEPGESIAQLVSRTEQWVRQRSTCALIVQAYDRNGTQANRLAEIVQLQAEAARLADRYQQVAAVLFFSFYRQGGAATYPSLEAASRAQFGQVPAKPPSQPPVDPPDEPPDIPPEPPGEEPMKSIEWGNIPFDVHGRQKQRIADLLTQHGYPTDAQHALDDDQIVGVFVDQTLKVGNITYKGVLPGDYAQWETDVFAHIARELRRLFGLPADPSLPPPLDFP